MEVSHKSWDHPQLGSFDSQEQGSLTERPCSTLCSTLCAPWCCCLRWEEPQWRGEFPKSHKGQNFVGLLRGYLTYLPQSFIFFMLKFVVSTSSNFPKNPSTSLTSLTSVGENIASFFCSRGPPLCQLLLHCIVGRCNCTLSGIC